MKKLTRDHVLRLTSAATGLGLAVYLAHAMAPNVALVLPKPPMPVPVSVRSVAPSAVEAAAPAPAQLAKELRLKSAKPVDMPKAPKPVPRPKPTAAPEPAPPVSTPQVLAPVAELPAPASAELPTLAQPSLQAMRPMQGGLPPMISADAPEVPPEAEADPLADRTYLEQPGGSVLVLGILVDERGLVGDTRILVPSFKPLFDLSVQMGSLRQTWTNIQPAIAPGERRWIELRFPLEDIAKPSLALP